MRENRTYGSEGGEGLHPFPTPIKFACLPDDERGGERFPLFFGDQRN